MQTEREYREKLQDSHINLIFYSGPPRSGKSTAARAEYKAMQKGTSNTVAYIDADAARRSLARRGQYKLPYDAAQEHAVLTECMLHLEQTFDAYMHRTDVWRPMWVYFVDTSWCETGALRDLVLRTMKEYFKVDVQQAGIVDSGTALSTCMHRVQSCNIYLAPVILRAAVRSAFDTFLTSPLAAVTPDAVMQKFACDVSEFCDKMDEHAITLR